MILAEAEKHGIKWEKIAYTDLFKLKYKNQIKFFYAQISSETTAFALYCCNNKRIAKSIIEASGLSVSKGYLIKYSDQQQYHLNIFKNLKKPLVVKPVDDQQGNNVYINICNTNQYVRAIKEIYSSCGKKKIDLLVEQMFEGNEYRILATQKKILSVIKRLPANVIGDGKSTIQQLVEIKNQDPIRIELPTYNQIVVDQKVIDFLKKQNLTLQTIVKINKRVFLRLHSPLDISLGGDTIDVTDKIHPSVGKIVAKIMESIPGLAFTGIDYMTKDIYKEQTANNYIIVEINASPSLDWNEYPIEGPKRRVAYEFLKVMFPHLT